MQFVSPKSLRIRGLLVLAAIVVGVDLYAAVGPSVTYARVGYQNLSRPHRLARNADLDPLSYYAPTGALVAARQSIPRLATYAIVVGSDPPGAVPEIIQDVYKLWLVPRRYTDRLSEAQWVIAYHHSSETLGVRYTKEIGLGPGVNLVQVAP
jgi:hypothetical protein